MAAAEVNLPPGFELDQPVAAPKKATASLKLPEGFVLDAEQEPRSLTDNLGRQVGLTARSAITGVSALPAIGADALLKIVNAGIRATGIKIPELPESSMAALERLLSGAGLPEPENATERVVYDANKGLASAASTIGTAGFAAPSSRFGQGIRSMLRSAPATQLQAAGGGSAAASVANEAGAGPGGQLAAGVAGSIAAPAAVGVANAVGRTAAGIVRPFTEAGREKIVGDTLAALSDDAAAAQSRLANAKSIVPGSEPTTAAVARDYGLATAERAMQSGAAGSRFADAASKNNEARTALLSGMAKDRQAIEAAETARDAATRPMRDAAFANAQQANTQAVVAKIDALLQGGAGKQEPVEKALNWLKTRLQGETSPERLYAVRKDIGLAMDGRLAGEQQGFRLAREQLLQAREALDEAIEKAAPGFRGYLAEYRARSQPINQMETLQDVAGRVVNPGTDKAGNQLLSPAKWFRVVTQQKDDLRKTLTPAQMKNLELIAKDLDSDAFVASANKAIGSNTFQNMSTANVVGSLLGGNVNRLPAWLQTATRPLSFLYKVPDQRIDELMVDAMLDPALANSLMHKATPKNLATVGRELLIKARAMGIAGAESQTARTQPEDRRNSR